MGTAISTSERDAVAAICLLAAFCDGDIDDRERGRMRAAIEGLEAEGGTPGDGASNQVYQRVIFGKTDAAREAAALSTPETRRLAYEMAVSVCDADGVSTPAEQKFLGELASACGISPEEAARCIKQADQVSGEPVGASAGAGSMPPPVPSGPVAAAAVADSQRDKEIDGSILNYSILNGALELLPQGLASAAIIPLQMKMVYEIGKRYGYTLSSGSIKDFLATAGVGITSQVVEGFARRLMGGLIQNVGGHLIGRTAAGMLSGVAQKATSTGFTFAATYGLGQVAKQYYAGGRKLSAIDLQALFTRQVGSAKGMYSQYQPQIAEQARRVNPMQLLNLVRGA